MLVNELIAFLKDEWILGVLSPAIVGFLLYYFSKRVRKFIDSKKFKGAMIVFALVFVLAYSGMLLIQPGKINQTEVPIFVSFLAVIISILSFAKK